MKNQSNRIGLGIDSSLARIVILSLLSVTWAIVILPKLGLGVAGVIAILTVTAICSIAFAVSLRLKHKAQKLEWRQVWPAELATVLGSGALLVSAIRSEGIPWWVTREDMVWNTVQSLLLNADGGVDPDLHANPAPLTNALFAVTYGVDPSLSGVLRTHSVVILCLVTLLSLLAGLYAARRTSQIHPVARVCLVFALGWLPFTALGLKNVMELGHVNVLTSLLLLWAAWILYCEDGLNVRSRFSLLLLSATGLLASWAPVAVLPCALALVLGYESWATRKPVRSLNWKPYLLPATAILQLILYVLFVTLPDLKRASGALSAEGAIRAIDPSNAIVLFLAIALIALYALQTQRRGGEAWRIGVGMIALLLVSVLVMAYLMWQRRNLGSLWGYYPIKYVGLLLPLLLGVATIAIAAAIRPHWKRARQIVVASFALPMYLLAIFSSAQGQIGVNAFAPTLSAAVTSPSPQFTQAMQDLTYIEDADLTGLTLVLHWSDGNDALMNNFMLQLATESGSDPLREYAYGLDIDNAEQFCDLVALSDQPVTVFTRLGSAELSDRYLSNCRVGDRVTVRNELPTHDD